MKLLLLTIVLTISSLSYADWEIHSAKIFKKATKGFYQTRGESLKLKKNETQKAFIQSYISKLKKTSKFKLSKTLKIKHSKRIATVYFNKKHKPSINCSRSESLSNCLYGGYDSYAFVVKNTKGELISVGHSLVLEFEVNRFGNTGVEKEMIIFKGKNKGTGFQANW